MQAVSKRADKKMPYAMADGATTMAMLVVTGRSQSRESGFTGSGLPAKVPDAASDEELFHR
jgi:hypothetical protein